MSSQVFTFQEVSLLARAAAESIVSKLMQAIRERKTASLALAGGTSPLPVYSALVSNPFATQLDWDRVCLYWGDERCVAKTDPASNFGITMKALRAFDRTSPVHRTRIFRMHAEHESVEEACREYESLLPKEIDVLILGVGEDGHTASLFPGSLATHENKRRVMHVVGPKPPPQRITITPPVIRQAKHRIVITTGAAKAEKVYQGLYGAENVQSVPCQLARDGEWYLDTAAAALLKLPASSSS